LGWTSERWISLPLQSSAYVLDSGSREDASRCHRGLDYLVLARMAAEGSHSKSGFQCLDTGMSHSRRLAFRRDLHQRPLVLGPFANFVFFPEASRNITVSVVLR
jgi:hypothetical protein